MTLGNMRELGVQRLLASCLNDACRHTALIDVSSYPAETEVPSFQRLAACGKSGRKRVDARSTGNEQSAGQPRKNTRNEWIAFRTASVDQVL
jgi:hypothetical protein